MKIKCLQVANNFKNYVYCSFCLLTISSGVFIVEKNTIPKQISILMFNVILVSMLFAKLFIAIEHLFIEFIYRKKINNDNTSIFNTVVTARFSLPSIRHHYIRLIKLSKMTKKEKKNQH